MKIMLIGILLSTQSLWAAEYGVFMVVKGKVRIESAATTADAKVGSRVQEGETVITEAESRAKIVMSDRNIINVSPATKVKIEKYANSAQDKNVRINLIEGKIRNNVEQKYNGKNSKFEVRTATAVAGVRGTQFITSYNPTTKVTEVVTLRGQVTLQSIGAQDSAPAGEPVVINKGEKSEAGSDSGGASEPAKVPAQEIRQIETETNVRKEAPTSENSTPGGGANAKRGGGAGTITSPIGDLNNDRRSPVLDGATTRKFDKSKIKIITQPGN